MLVYRPSEKQHLVNSRYVILPRNGPHTPLQEDEKRQRPRAAEFLGHLPLRVHDSSHASLIQCSPRQRTLEEFLYYPPLLQVPDLLEDERP